MSERLLSVRSVAKRLDCHANTVWGRVRSGVMPKPAISGGCTRWRESDIDTYIRSQFPNALADTVADIAT